MRHLLILFALLAGMLRAEAAAAQGYPFSQRGIVAQTVAFTRVEIEYGRPTARGRVLFGALVPWDSIWHPGADSATTLTLSHAVTLDGQTVSAGAYSLWLIPRATGPWTLIVSRATAIAHTPYPGAASDVVRLDVTPDTATHVETLTYAFPEVLRDAAVIRLQWGRTGVSVRLRAPFRPGAPPASRP
jgi:hypothetical protein